MTRVLLCYQPVDGGVGRHVADLAVGLSRRGIEIVLCGPPLDAGFNVDARRAPLELERAVSPARDLEASAGLARLIGELEPDLVHAHSSKAGAVARLARLAHPRTPVLYTPHGYSFAGHFQRVGERRFYKGVERALAPLASCVVCVCEAEARLARSIGPASRVRVVHNGVSPPTGTHVDPRVAELARRGPVIGALTVLRPGKGLETLIDSMPHVIARRPEVQLAIFGGGPDLQALSARARLRGVGAAVHFLGQTTDPLAAIRGMDLFVHPSWAEALPYALLEAMSLARPIVASDVGGISEALTDGQSGMLVPPRDDGALAAAVLGLLEQPARAAQLGARALAAAQGRFTAQAMIDRLTGVYDDIMSLPPGMVPRERRSEGSPTPASPLAGAS